MPRLRSRTLTSRDWTGFHRRQLRDGFDFLQSAWGDNLGDPETIADMRQAWHDNREQMLRADLARGAVGRPWAWWCFDVGLGPVAALSMCGEREALALAAMNSKVIPFSPFVTD